MVDGIDVSSGKTTRAEAVKCEFRHKRGGPYFQRVGLNYFLPVHSIFNFWMRHPR
jgi:hypothetical protein